MDGKTVKEQRGSRRQSGMPTINDVAARASVSAMTVSRVINGERNVRATTRDAVMAAIEALNYAPNRAAQSLAGAAQIRMGLLYSNPSASYLSAFLVGSLDQASGTNIQLVVEKCEPNDHEVDVALGLIKSGIDGLILPPPLCDSEALIALLLEKGVPAVAVATARPADRLSTVSVDDHRASFEMTRYIASLGHRRIGFIGGDSNLSASERRLIGYRDALEAEGIAFNPDLVAPGLFTYRSGLAGAERLLDVSTPPTAIFAANDDMAAATVAVAHRRGLDVPRDLTVCGYDDTILATAIWPELTTVRQPVADMSRAAIQLLAEEIRRRRDGKRIQPQQLLQDFTLMLRQSSAPPRRTSTRHKKPPSSLS
jgi:LacI family transcriptional regulator